MTEYAHNLALLTTPLQYWQEVAQQLLKANKTEALRYIRAQAGVDLLEASEIADELTARTINQQIEAKGKMLMKDASDLEMAHKEIDRLRTALQPFAQDLTEWKAYIESGGEMSIIDFFTDYLEDDVLLANLERARKALEPATAPADAAEEANHDAK